MQYDYFEAENNKFDLREPQFEKKAGRPIRATVEKQRILVGI